MGKKIEKKLPAKEKILNSFKFDFNLYRFFEAISKIGKFNTLNRIMSDNFNLCIIAQQLPKASGGEILLKRFIKIFDPMCSCIIVITSNYPESSLENNKITLIDIKTDDKNESIVIRCLKYILMQVKMSIRMVTVSKRVSAFIFFVGGSALLLPMITAKLLNKKVALESTGSGQESVRAIHREQLFGLGGKALSPIMKIVEGMNYRMADRIIVSSNHVIHILKLNTYGKKIRIAQSTFYDLNKFHIFKNITERNNIIGYIGRLSEEKGIFNFIEAIPIMLKDNTDIEFVIIGSGRLQDRIDVFVKENNLLNKVTFKGWLHNELLPDYLNNLKLLVVPSYTEGLPSVVMEGMACGVPVLATPVGSIPEIVIDNESGFIMENNSPECIASNAKRAMMAEDLDRIIKNARSLIEKKFTYSNVVKDRRAILVELLNEGVPSPG